MNNIIHPSALIQTNKIGKNTTIDAFTCILPRARIGKDCTIGSHVYIDNDVIIGDNVKISNGVNIYASIIEDNVYIGTNVTFAKRGLDVNRPGIDEDYRTIIKEGAYVGANATIHPGVKIGLKSIINSGTVVTNDLPAGAIVAGNPAKIIEYSTTTDSSSDHNSEISQQKIMVHKVAKLIELPIITDLRGSLTFGEYDKHLPFDPLRYFIVYNVPSEHIRGEHAHKKLHQFLICISGSCSVVVNDGLNREEVLLNQPNLGLYVPPMTWTTQYKFSNEAFLLVLASDIYKAEDYIRDYDQFLNEVNRKSNHAS